MAWGVHGVAPLWPGSRSLCAAQKSSPGSQGSSLGTGRLWGWGEPAPGGKGCGHCAARGDDGPIRGCSAAPMPALITWVRGSCPATAGCLLPSAPHLSLWSLLHVPARDGAACCRSRVSLLLHTPSLRRWHRCSRGLQSVAPRHLPHSRWARPHWAPCYMGCHADPPAGPRRWHCSGQQQLELEPSSRHTSAPSQPRPSSGTPAPNRDWGPQSRQHTVVPAPLRGSEAERSHVNWATQ